MKKFALLVVAVMGMILNLQAEQRWSEWQSVGKWPSLEYRFKRSAEPINQGKYEWDVQFRNNYAERINFSFRLTNPGTVESVANLTDRMQLRAGKTDSSWALLTSSQEIIVWTGKVRFGVDDSGSYAVPR